MSRQQAERTLRSDIRNTSITELMLIFVFLFLLMLAATETELLSAEAKISDLERFKEQVFETNGITSEEAKQKITQQTVLTSKLREQVAGLKSDFVGLSQKLADKDKQIRAMTSRLVAADDLKQKLVQYGILGRDGRLDAAALAAGVEASQSLPALRAALQLDKNANAAAITEKVLATAELAKAVRDSLDINDQQPVSVVMAALDEQSKNLSDMADRVQADADRRGQGIPECWRKDGKSQYLFNITITDRGYSVYPGWDEDRKGDLRRIPGVKAMIGSIPNSGKFASLARPIFNHGKSGRFPCLYTVRIYDGTSRGNKSGWKNAVATLNRYFHRFETTERSW